VMCFSIVIHRRLIISGFPIRQFRQTVFPRASRGLRQACES